MDLKDLLVETKSAWVEYPGIEGFEVEVAMLSRPSLIKLRKSCTTSRWDRKANTAIEELNEDKFVSKFSEATVKDWKGLTLGEMEGLALIDVGEFPLEAVVDYSQSNAETLVKNSNEFDTWLNEVVFDLDNFRS
jgi:hypothetical protein